ncbi:carbonic anhydrase [Schlesneria paludicola]|uniref:carbonic anhydrase n=1 Tax=Schlesneria paludicola TaxID=360056 RepID=UPI00029A9ED4|nr:carbonic anhydrase [Schlesneria paludicola]
MDLIYRYDPHLPISVECPSDSAAAMRLLCDGNLRLTSVVAQMQKATLGEGGVSEIVVPMSPVSLGLPLVAGAVSTQRPYALVLGCSDARVPVEPIFDQSFNDLFVLRIAGNVLGTECLGSFDYAVRQFADSLKLVVVLGHTGCGAVSAAVETYLSPTDYADIAFTHALRSLIDRIMIAVRGAAGAIQQVCGRKVQQHPNYKDALIEVAVYLNAAITAFDLRREIAAFGGGSMHVVYGVYDLATLFVSPIPAAHPTKPGFAPAPQQENLTTLGQQLAQAVVDKGVLGE